MRSGYSFGLFPSTCIHACLVVLPFSTPTPLLRTLLSMNSLRENFDNVNLATLQRNVINHFSDRILDQIEIGGKLISEPNPSLMHDMYTRIYCMSHSFFFFFCGLLQYQLNATEYSSILEEINSVVEAHNKTIGSLPPSQLDPYDFDCKVCPCCNQATHCVCTAANGPVSDERSVYLFPRETDI